MGSSLEVVVDDVGDVGVEGLVVCDAGAEGVGQGDVACAVGVEETGDAEDGVGAEGHRVDEVVVDAAVDDIDAAQATGGAHVDDIVVGDQVAAFHQFDAHLACEVGVLEVGGVEDARREQNDVGLWAALGRERSQRAQQQLGVLLDGADVVAAEELGKDALHHAPIGEHVADAGGDAQVVFQDDELTIRMRMRSVPHTAT